jgi:hypothetical protein
MGIKDGVLSSKGSYILLVGYQTDKSGSTNLIRLINSDEIDFIINKK